MWWSSSGRAAASAGRSPSAWPRKARTSCASISTPTRRKPPPQALTAIYGMGIGVAGTGISGCGPALGLSADITNRDSVRQMLDQVLLAYGGIDNLIVTAGVFVPPDKSGHIPDAKWRLTFDVNVLGGYIVADEARRIWEAQALPGTPGADDQRERGRGESRIAGLRHQQGGRQSPGARAGRGAGAAGARQRAGPRDGGRWQQHVPPRACDQPR